MRRSSPTHRGPPGLMPSAASAIVMGVAHSPGAVRAPGIRLWTRNKMRTSRLLDRVAGSTARELERRKAISRSPYRRASRTTSSKRDPETGVRLSRTRTAGQLSLKHAAVSAGLEQIGLSNLLLAPECGPHQRLAAVATEEPLVPDAPRSLELRYSCGACRRACPAGASETGSHDVDPRSTTGRWGCRSCGLRVCVRCRPVCVCWRNTRGTGIIIEAGRAYTTDVDHFIECMRACPLGERWASCEVEDDRGG